LGEVPHQRGASGKEGRSLARKEDALDAVGEEGQRVGGEFVWVDFQSPLELLEENRFFAGEVARREIS
jgi:hypothetical protein